ncbi:TolC family protein [Marinoscillum furvescens]|uniref:Outer membrane efflux protein n=1 Tax=Marinoscillum furvescens DSM 4134 TaxID=1122208 RepID=A0A3D9L338_MARFU|nr:TolC family protein [Marinoscillum furvescens]RED97071.1 outer membrane efflux protein [Marinoscillum furvescens DSM 4134]
MRILISTLMLISYTVALGQVAKGFQEYDEAFAQRLVRVALQNNPKYDMAQSQLEIAEYDVKLSNLEWLNTVQVSGNLNEFNIDPEQDVYNRSQFLPRYNVRGSITLGMFFTIPVTTKKRKEQVEVAQAVVQDQRKTLEAEVLRRYHSYVKEVKIFRLQEEVLMDMENTFKAKEDQFTAGEISFQDYSVAREAYNARKITYYQAEATLRSAKASLEELLGTELESIQ